MHNHTQNRHRLKLIRTIAIIQFHSLEAFSFLPVITLWQICFLSIASIFFRETVKYFQLCILHGHTLFSEEICNELRSSDKIFQRA